MSLSWNRRMTAFCSSSVAVHSCSSSSSCSAVSSSVSIALVPSRSAAVRGQVAMPYEDSQERTSPPSLSHRTAHLSKMGVRPTRSVHNPDELSFGHSPATCPQSNVSGQEPPLTAKITGVTRTGAAGFSGSRRQQGQRAALQLAAAVPSHGTSLTTLPCYDYVHPRRRNPYAAH